MILCLEKEKDVVFIQSFLTRVTFFIFREKKTFTQILKIPLFFLFDLIKDHHCIIGRITPREMTDEYSKICIQDFD